MTLKFVLIAHYTTVVMLEGPGFVISSFCYLCETLTRVQLSVWSPSYSMLVNKIKRVKKLLRDCGACLDLHT